MPKILLITPPFVQPNCPYPATAYLKGYLMRQGIEASQLDLSVELLNAIFSAEFLAEVFSAYDNDTEQDDADIARIYALRGKYISTVDTVMAFLRGEDDTLANLISMPDYIPQGGRFGDMAELQDSFGVLGTRDCARYICTLYLQDIGDFIRAVVTEDFEIVKYAEKISVSVPSFLKLEERLNMEPNIIERRMTDLLAKKIDAEQPDFVGFTIPFPGNLVSSLRCAKFLKNNYPEIGIIAGGGYPTTELRSMSDKGIFRYFDHIILDDGQAQVAAIVNGGDKGSQTPISHIERGCPDFSDLPLKSYFSLLEVINPMHRLWSDGRWNKMTIAHGCYWAKCAFCDTSLDYIRCYDTVTAEVFVDWMESVAAQTGSRGFHFVDEAAPPKLLRDISLEILRRGLNFSWWTNIRFEKSFTGDLCRLMAAAGCIAVSGGLEVASDRLLEMINKGVTIASATMAMRNFYYSGIMTHTYLMYGLPTQTLQETVDALEVVRQMFKAELMSSAFWHRYAMTIHSPSGKNPEAYGTKRKNDHVNTFANNEVYFVEDRGYNLSMTGAALNLSLANFMSGNALDRPVHKWFESKVPQTTVEDTLIVDHLIKPDASRMFNENARLVWIGAAMPQRTNDGLLFNAPSIQKEITLTDPQAEFVLEITEQTSNLSQTITFAQVKDIYAKHSEESFAVMYHSKKWDKMREFGLLQI